MDAMGNRNNQQEGIGHYLRHLLRGCLAVFAQCAGCSGEKGRIGRMDQKNGFDLIEQLRKENGKPYQRYGEIERFLDLKAREKGIPLSGKFELTPLCNFSCKMCYVHLGADQLKGQPVLPVEAWKDLMRQAWEAGMIGASLTGGECLAYPGFEELFLYLHSLGCSAAVLTNGFLLDDSRIRFFKEHTPAMIQVSLYGWNDDVYERVTGKRAFTTVADNFRRAAEADLPVFISITPSRYLGEDIFETIRAARELSRTVMINTFYTSPREETGRSGYQGDAETELYIRALQYMNRLEGHETVPVSEACLPPCGGSCRTAAERGFLCGGGRSSFAIDWKGTMTPCTDMTLIRGYPLQEGFAAAWSKVNREVNNWPRVPECAGCAYDDVCHNCAASVLRYADPGKKPAGLCAQTREFVRCGVKRIPECG